MKILIIEDEPELLKSMMTYLKAENYLCETAKDYKSGLAMIESFNYDCILLDVTLPDGNGLNLLKELKSEKKTDGVIVISARDSIEDRIRGLNLGADDYLVKPFHLSELNARISSVIRRRRFEGQRNLEFHEISIDLIGKNVLVNGQPIELTRKEYDLLLFMAYNKNRVLSKNAIAEHLSGVESDLFDSFDFIYTHMKNLKRKLSHAGAGDYIKSIYGMGYKFEV